MNRRTALDATQAPPQATRTARVTARDGTSLFVQDWGSGPPVVFLAAWTFDASIWGYLSLPSTTAPIAASRRTGVGTAGPTCR